MHENKYVGSDFFYRENIYCTMRWSWTVACDRTDDFPELNSQAQHSIRKIRRTDRSPRPTRSDIPFPLPPFYGSWIFSFCRVTNKLIFHLNKKKIGNLQPPTKRWHPSKCSSWWDWMDLAWGSRKTDMISLYQKLFYFKYNIIFKFIMMKINI